MLGRWYTEFTSKQEFEKREEKRWASWDNRRSFWLMREEVIQLISDCWFNVVLEQHDHLAPDIRTNMRKEFYHIHDCNTFLGLNFKWSFSVLGPRATPQSGPIDSRRRRSSTIKRPHRRRWLQTSMARAIGPFAFGATS
jgi:hypothetical protein